MCIRDSAIAGQLRPLAPHHFHDGRAITQRKMQPVEVLFEPGGADRTLLTELVVPVGLGDVGALGGVRC